MDDVPILGQFLHGPHDAPQKCPISLRHHSLFAQQEVANTPNAKSQCCLLRQRRATNQHDDLARWVAWPWLGLPLQGPDILLGVLDNTL